MTIYYLTYNYISTSSIKNKFQDPVEKRLVNLTDYCPIRITTSYSPSCLL